MELFAQIQKVDEEKRLVFGRAADETPDKSGELLNYAGSKPHFIKWSDEISKDTDGRSLGNLRAMHGKIAAGKLKDIHFDDAKCTIDVCAKVVDDNEWKKVIEGVYTGFSIGGAYGEKTVEKIDDKEFTRYIAIPSEISLVDRPCIPTAKFFQVQKLDGTTEDVEFKKIDDVEVVGSTDEVLEFGKLMNENNLTMSQVIEMVKVATREDVNPKAGEEKYGDIEYADAKNNKYPLDTEEHVRAAASYFGMPKNRAKYSADDQKTIEGKIASAEKKFKIGEGKDEADKTEKVMKAIRSELRKGLAACAQFANLILALQQLRASVQYESYQEGDNSPVPGKIDACISLCGSVLKEMIDEETAEGGGEEDESALAMAASCGELVKHADPAFELVKYGARNSANDKQRMDAIHKAVVELGADCSGPSKVAGAEDELKKVEEVKKAIADAVIPLQKALDEANERVKKLEDQPLPTTVRLNAVAVSKAEDVDQNKKGELEMVKDDHGAAHPAATMIKQQQQSGGVPLTLYRG